MPLPAPVTSALRRTGGTLQRSGRLFVRRQDEHEAAVRGRLHLGAVGPGPRQPHDLALFEGAEAADAGLLRGEQCAERAVELVRNVAPTGLGDYFSWAVRDGRNLILTIASNYYYLEGDQAVLPAGRVSTVHE